MPISTSVPEARTPDIADEHSPADPATTLLTRPARIHHVIRQSAEDEGGLLDDVAASTEDRVLVVGGTTADLLCASVRRGCRSAIGVSRAPLHPDAAEVVVAPRVASLDQATEIACCARKALSHGTHEGRLAMRLPGIRTLGLAAGLVRQLKALGYARIHLRRARGDSIVVTGRLAILSPSA